MWEVVDDNGTIHSGDEEEMRYAFTAMTEGILCSQEDLEEWGCDWRGDLKLIEVHNVYR